VRCLSFGNDQHKMRSSGLVLLDKCENIKKILRCLSNSNTSPQFSQTNEKSQKAKEGKLSTGTKRVRIGACIHRSKGGKNIIRGSQKSRTTQNFRGFSLVGEELREKEEGGGRDGKGKF